MEIYALHGSSLTRQPPFPPRRHLPLRAPMIGAVSSADRPLYQRVARRVGDADDDNEDIVIKAIYLFHIFAFLYRA